MIGSTFVSTLNPEALAHIACDVEAISQFAHVELEQLITLDFEEICSASNTSWAIGDPIVFDEESGIAIFRINPDGLTFVIGQKTSLNSVESTDIALLESFVKEHGVNHIYEVATF